MYCKANFKSVAKCKKRLCTAVFALFKKNTRRVAWPVLQSRCKALSALSQNTLKNTKTGRKSVGFLILTQAPKCTRSHCFPPQKHPKNGFVMRFAGKNSFFQLRARDFSFYMNAYNRKRSPGKRLFAPRPFLLSYTIPPLRHFLRVRRPSAKKALQSGAKACIINASNMLTERVRARFCPPAERGAAGCKRPGMVSRRSSLTSGFAEGCGW